MDKLEAIKWLKSIKDKYIHGGDENYDSKRAEAIDFAIAALGGAVKTNADRIRAMSDEELAEYLADIASEANNGVIYSDRPEEWLEYLQQPAEVDGDGA